MRKNPKSQNLCSASAELIGGNDDLLGVLLPHLPVKSLTRFKSVSQQWCALISSPQFRRRHSTLENPPSSRIIPSGLYLYNPTNFKDQTLYSIPCPRFQGKIPLIYSDPVYLPDNIPIKLRELLPEKKDIRMRVVQSCNGLNLFKFNKAYCVRNLVTNQLNLIPVPDLDPKKGERIVTFCLAFDPLVSPHYKVICAYKAPSGGFTITSKFTIFSSETGQWKETNVSMDGCELQYAKGEYCHGAIYWIVLKDKLSSYRFDIEAEDLTEISMPTKDNSGLRFRSFGESSGHLYFVCFRDYNEKLLIVYELDQVSMNWFIKHSVHINCVLSSLPQVTVNGRNQVNVNGRNQVTVNGRNQVNVNGRNQVTVHGRNQMHHSTPRLILISVLRGEEEDDLTLVINIFDKVVSYNFMSKKVEVLLSDLRWKEKSRRVDYVSAPRFVPAYPFIASLYPLE